MIDIDDVSSSPESTEVDANERKMLTNEDISEFYDYRVVLKSYTLYKDAYEWCNTNFPKDTEFHWSIQRWFTGGEYVPRGEWGGFKYNYCFYFKTSEDATLFALRWV